MKQSTLLLDIFNQMHHIHRRQFTELQITVYIADEDTGTVKTADCRRSCTTAVLEAAQITLCARKGCSDVYGEQGGVGYCSMQQQLLAVIDQ
ncbi:uncharacterized protein DS421_13g424010 [Arachis hypogaea]|nr:uncharacterized protein DS421_13g424010 [Arachis hypogaea]